MKTNVIVMVLAVLGGAEFPAAHAAARPEVLITAFEPFKGFPNNGSALVAEKAKVMLAADANVTLCIVPVVFREAGETAMRCYQKMIQKPDVVLSMGEGGCGVRLEYSAENLNWGKSPDNAGHSYPGTLIDPSGPDHIELGLPLKEFACSTPFSDEERALIKLSADAGNYVCNNTAYILGRFFKSEKIPYGFVHVPETSCTKREPRMHDVSARIMVKLIKSALALPNKHTFLRAGENEKSQYSCSDFSRKRRPASSLDSRQDDFHSECLRQIDRNLSEAILHRDKRFLRRSSR